MAAGFPCQEPPPALCTGISPLARSPSEKALSCHHAPDQRGSFSSPAGCIAEEAQPKPKATVPPWLIPSSAPVRNQPSHP